jgi:hypothetical protein
MVFFSKFGTKAISDSVGCNALFLIGLVLISALAFSTIHVYKTHKLPETICVLKHSLITVTTVLSLSTIFTYLPVHVGGCLDSWKIPLGYLLGDSLFKTINITHSSENSAGGTSSYGTNNNPGTKQPPTNQNPGVSNNSTGTQQQSAPILSLDQTLFIFP